MRRYLRALFTTGYNSELQFQARVLTFLALITLWLAAIYWKI